MVMPIFSYGNEKKSLEVTGTKTNVLISDYVAKFLDNELEDLWKNTKKENPHLKKGVRSKNSFMKGVCEGYLSKMQNIKKQMSGEDQKALIKIDRQLSTKIRDIYPRLGSTGHFSITDETSQSLGISAGRSLSIHQGVTQNQQTAYLEMNT